MNNEKMDNTITHTINDGGKYNGVSYKINNVNVIERDGKTFIEFDYDVFGLDEQNTDEFEKYLGNMLIESIEQLIESNN